MPTPSEVPSNQNPDSRQGGEGTTINPANTGEALLKSIGGPGDRHEDVPAKDSGTK